MEKSNKIQSGTGKNENSKEKAVTEHNVHLTMYNVSYELLFSTIYLVQALHCKPSIKSNFLFIQDEKKKGNLLKALQFQEIYGKMPTGTKVYMSLGAFVRTRRLSGKDKPNISVRDIQKQI